MPGNAARPAWNFESFYTPKAHGTGLELPIARRLIEAHGGQIAAAMPEGAGAEFVIVLPHDPGGFPTHPPPDVQPPRSGEESGGTPQVPDRQRPVSQRRFRAKSA